MRQPALLPSLPTPRSVLGSTAKHVRRHRWEAVLVAAALFGMQIAPALGIDLNSGVAAAQSAPATCGLAQPAFCEPFNTPSTLGAGTRSGNLNGVLWGVSRATSNDNPSAGMLYQWVAGTRSTCGFNQTVAPEQDVQICNGQMVDTVNDGTNVTDLALYPRQPFDIAGRTGTAVFDVNNDTQGPHAAWPAFVYTDQPVPAPYSQAAGLADTPRNSFGFSLASPNCDGTMNTTGVDTMWTTSNYQLNMQSFTTVGCVQKATDTTSLNHFEVHINQSHVEVWGTDPGSSTLRELAYANFTVPLTRGLVWIEDVHYNANKFNTQGNHSFVWRNVGFDGPILPRDLAYDILDATHNGTSGGNLGYLIPTGGQLSLQFTNVQGVQNATAALLEFTWWPHGQDSVTFSMNGHATHTQPWPYVGSPTYVSQTLALPVPLSELQTGTNAVALSSSDNQLGGVTVANLDLILVGAGGMPNAAPTPVPVAATATPVPATATSVPAPATPIPANTPVATATSAPPTPAPSVSQMLLGTETIGSSLDNNSAGQAEAFPYPASATGTAGHVDLYIDGSNTANAVTVGVYTNTASNQPGTLLGQTTIHSPVAGWNRVSIGALNIVAGTKYWIAVLAPAGSTGSIEFRDQASGTSITSQQTNLASLPATWTSGQTWTSGGMSAYATN